MFSTNPSTFERYAQRTADTKPSMDNVTSIPKRAKCVDCGKQRTEMSGQYKKRGFVCGMCK